MHALLEAGRDRLSAGPLGVRTDSPETSLIVPTRPEELQAHYDLTLSHPRHAVQFLAFDRWLARAAGMRGLSCALLHEGVVSEAVRRLQQGQLTIGFHLDYFSLWHVANDPHTCLTFAVQDAGGRSINLPARSRYLTDKSAAHAELKRRGLGVPDTVIVRPWASDRALTLAERAQLRLDEPGARVYVKPANGYCGRGIARVDRTDPESLAAALAAARQFDRQDTYLVQREVRSPRLVCDDGGARLAYWRVLYCLGELIPFWWSHDEMEQGRPSYRRLSVAEVRRHGLRPVLAFAAMLARLARLDWFSTELCLSEGPEPSRYRVTGADGRERPVVAIDYVNDQCDVDVQSRWAGAPPDAVVQYVAERFAEAALQAAGTRQVHRKRQLAA
jgi:hypothetical protein